MGGATGPVQVFLSGGGDYELRFNVEGQSAFDASMFLLTERFGVSYIYDRSETVPAGHVISQSPGQYNWRGEQIYLPEGFVFCLTISTGPSGLVVVPDVVGQLWLDAESALTSVGLEVLYTYEPSLTVDPDYVISQSPAAGAEGPPGSAMRVIVSLGPDGS